MQLVEARALKMLIVLEPCRQSSTAISESSETEHEWSLRAGSFCGPRGLFESRGEVSKENPRIVRRPDIVTNVQSES